MAWSERPLRPNRALLAGLSLVVLILTGGSGSALASDEPGKDAETALTAEPRAVIQKTVDDVVAILAQKDRSTEERISEIEEIAYEVFDFTTMSKLVLARNWRKMDKQQRSDFVHEFKLHLSRTYGSRLDRYSQEQVDVYGAQVEPRDDVSIKTRILGGQFDGAEISYRLRSRKDRWRIIDVVIEGVSLVSNYRSQFAEILNNGSIEDLLAKLRDKNFKIDEEEPAQAASAQ
jgi:phospholipid transport system substrate-binding protein